jgi:hypothetical protein
LALLLAWLSQINFSVMAQSNSPPIIALTSPPSGSWVSFGGVLRLKASASDPDGSIVAVRFYQGTNPLGTVSEAPYNLAVRNHFRLPGYYDLTAAATDNQGASSTSAPVTIFVFQDPIPPRVSITEPKDGDVFLAPATIAVTAAVVVYDGSENPVRFFSGTNFIGSASGPPYTLVTSNLPPGQHRFTARYTDGAGNSGTSPEVRILLSPLALANPGRLSDGAFHFTVTGLSTGRNFVVQAANPSLLWAAIATNFASSNMVLFIDNSITNTQTRFYRALQELR